MAAIKDIGNLAPRLPPLLLFDHMRPSSLVTLNFALLWCCCKSNSTVITGVWQTKNARQYFVMRWSTKQGARARDPVAVRPALSHPYRPLPGIARPSIPYIQARPLPELRDPSTQYKPFTMPRPSDHEESDDDDYERDDARAEAATGGGGRRRKKKRSSAREEEDGQEDDNNDTSGRVAGGGGKKKKKKSKKVKVMEESGQTDEERRALRRAQRKLQHKIVQSEVGDELEIPGTDAFDKIRGENNQLFDDVRYTREAVLDGDNLELISRRAARQVDKLVQVSTSAP